MPNWVAVDMKDCKVNMSVKIVNKRGVPGAEELFYGIVKDLKKPNKFVLYVFVGQDQYSKHDPKVNAVTLRTKWQPKLQAFGNSRKLEIFYDDDAWNQAANTRKAQSSQYSDARKLYTQKRAQMLKAFTLLGLTPRSTQQELRTVQKKLMFEYHPDRLPLILRERLQRLGITDAQGPEAKREADTLASSAKECSDAIAFVNEYMKRRDGDTQELVATTTST